MSLLIGPRRTLIGSRAPRVPTPSAPSVLSATAGDTLVNLAWTDNSSDETAFAIFRGTDGVTFAEVTTVAAGVVIYSDTGLTNGTTYYYYVVARNAGGDSAASNTASAKASSLANGLVEFYKLSDVNGVNGITLTNNNGVTFVAGLVGNAASFASASLQSLTRATRVWGMGNALSVSCWHKSTSTGGCIWQLGDNLAVPSSSAIKFESTYVYASNNASAVFKHYNGITDSTGVWLHTVVTWDGTNLKVYRGGVDITAGMGKPTDNAGTMSDVTRKFRIGAADNVAISAYHNGLVDALGLWSRALTAGDVTSLYAAGAGLEQPF